MSVSSDVIVKLDDRVLLMSAALAATRYPEQEQVSKPHGTHAHARATRKRLAQWAEHDAVKSLQSLLDQKAPLEALFSLALTLRLPGGTLEKPPRWMPPGWDAQLADFYAAAELPQWWASEGAHWQKALADSQQMFSNIRYKSFFQPYIGEIRERLIFIPNVSYPTDYEIGLRLASEIVCIIPPRVAWGDNPPWPFSEDPAHLYRASLVAFGRQLMTAYLRANAERIGSLDDNPLPVTDKYKALYPTWYEQFTNLFVAGAVAIFLEDHVSQAEANAYVLMERKYKGLEILPGVINVFRHYLRELETGRYQTLLDLLPNFSKRLRIANKLVSL
jgi:hypothetical protein